MAPTTPQTVLTGCAGEHFVAYRLSAMGYLVALTRVGASSVDLMVATPDGQKAVTVQVKTAKKAFYRYKKHPEKNCWSWRVSPKAKRSLFYAFVDLKGSEGREQPDVFIVRTDSVAEYLSNAYPKGFAEPTQFWFEIMEEDKDKWHEAWHLITQDLAAGR